MVAQSHYSNSTQGWAAWLQRHGQISPLTFWLEDGFNLLQKVLFHKGWRRAVHSHSEVFAVYIKHDGIVLGRGCRRECRDLLAHETEISHARWEGNELGGQDTPSAMLWQLFSLGSFQMKPKAAALNTGGGSKSKSPAYLGKDRPVNCRDLARLELMTHGRR